MWTEPLFVVLPANHSLSKRRAVTWADLADENFLVRHGGVGPQSHDHIVLRLARHRPAPSILRFDAGRCSLLEMVAQGFGVTIAGASVAHQPMPASLENAIITGVAAKQLQNPPNRTFLAAFAGRLP